MTSLQRVPSARGIWRTLPGGAGSELGRVHERVIAEIVRGVELLKGRAAADRLRVAGVDALHTALEPLDIGPLRDGVLEAVRTDLLKTAVHVGRAVMGWKDDFYVDDYVILRLNLPYAIAKSASREAENPGVGRLSPAVRAAAAARRKTDPVYDPVKYHCGAPPAAWAHGPHVDSWTGHSRDGLNLWWAMCDVPPEAGIVLYPKLEGDALPCDPTTMYLRRGYALPAPTSVSLAAGEMLIFDPEILHGTHLNVTPRTRVAVSLRLNARKPTFDPECFYAREFWRRASDIEAGDLGTILHLKREDNFAPRARRVAPVPPVSLRAFEVAFARDGRFATVGPSSLVGEGERIIASLPGRRIMLGRRNGALFALDAVCPHYGLDLADGGFRGTDVFCPGCAVGFNVATGRSAAPDLRLSTFAVREEDGTIVLALSA